MNWKNLIVIALAALFAITACKKKAAEETAPAAAPTEPATPPTEPAAQPTEPAQPAQPTEPVQPAQPAQPTEPAQPTAANGDACQGFVDKMLACAKEAAGGVEMPAEAIEATKSGFAQTCDAWKQAGQADMIGKALEACKDTACGAGGSDYMTCVGNEITKAAMAAAGVPATP